MNSYLKEYIYWVTLTYFLSGAMYWMKQLFIIKVNFIKNGCYLSSENFPKLPRSKIYIFSQLYSKKSIPKRVLLLGRDNIPTGSGIKIFARWKHWLRRIVLGLFILLLQSIQTACNFTRSCWSNSNTNRWRTWLLLQDWSRFKLFFCLVTWLDYYFVST